MQCKSKFCPHFTAQNKVGIYVKVMVTYSFKVSKYQDIFNTKIAKGNKTPNSCSCDGIT